jgi:hypothetical protein
LLKTPALVLTLLLACPAAGWAEWQIKPFIGTTLAGSSTFVVTDEAAGERHLAVGGTVTWLGSVFGVEGEVTRVPGFFEDDSVTSPLGSNITTLTGAVVVTLPRKWAGYSLRPYLTAGGGLMRVSIDQQEVFLDAYRTMKLVSLGGGATGFLTDRVGLNWDLRYFRTVGGEEGTGLSVGPEQVSYWRLSMGLTIRAGRTR